MWLSNTETDFIQTSFGAKVGNSIDRGDRVTYCNKSQTVRWDTLHLVCWKILLTKISSHKYKSKDGENIQEYKEKSQSDWKVDKSTRFFNSKIMLSGWQHAQHSPFTFWCTGEMYFLYLLLPHFPGQFLLCQVEWRQRADRGRECRCLLDGVVLFYPVTRTV